MGGNDVGVLPHLKTVQKPKTVPIIVRERRWKHENKKQNKIKSRYRIVKVILLLNHRYYTRSVVRYQQASDTERWRDELKWIPITEASQECREEWC